MTQEAAADHDGCEIRLEHQRLAERFHHDHGFDRAGAEAAVGFRERKTEQALLGELAPGSLAPAALLFHVFLAGVEVVRIGQQTIDAIFEEPLLLGQIKIHFSYSLRLSEFGGHPRLVRNCAQGMRGSSTPRRLGESRPPRRTGSPAFAGDDSCGCPYSPSTALAMMLRWISLEPP